MTISGKDSVLVLVEFANLITCLRMHLSLVLSKVGRVTLGVVKLPEVEYVFDERRETGEGIWFRWG